MSDMIDLVLMIIACWVGVIVLAIIYAAVMALVDSHAAARATERRAVR